MASSQRINREGVRRHRERLRRRGYRPIQLWVPDLRDPAIQAEARRQCEALARSPHAAEDQRFVDDLSEGVWDA